jgi:hypothetical protein
MKLWFTPRRLLPLDAWFARREPRLDAPDTRMPDDDEVLRLQALAGTRFGRVAAEVALAEGGERDYAPRQEAEVLDPRRP